MATQTRQASDRILSVLRRGPRRGLTAVEVSTRAELNLNTTRTTLWGLQGLGAVEVIGTTEPTRGRPANRYALAA